MLTKIYEHIKSDARFRQITLISGPLQGLQENRNAAVDYLRQTYRYGKNRLGWGTANRPYPFDGVGYHLYVLESYNANWQQHERNMRRVYKEYTAAFRRVIRNAEGRDKPIYLSETGWPSAENNDRSKTFQAKHLSLILELMNDDPAVAIGIWFCTEDFLPKEKFYGLYELNNPTPQGRKPAYYAYKEFCEALAEESGGPNGGVIPPPPGPLKPLPTPINPELEAWLTELRTRMLGLERQMIILQAQMTELVAKYETVDDLAAEIERLKDQVARLAEGGVGGPPKPPIEDLTATLPRHPTKQFGSRPIEQIQWLIIQHTGNNPAIGAQRIAEYLVGKGRPGLTYHYFINDQALIQQINPLTAETSHPQVVMVGFAGDFTDKIPTLAQIEAGADLLAWLLSGLGLPLEAVKGAKEVSNTRSPGDQWDSGQRWGDKLRQEVEERL